ncbi:Protocadherin-11 X-linked [Fasciolopsis buskii]|uniref:Protocadherin-11 X-linked n=1 Tax=Fasciolopsis buskii TaxID=27845 RepID=A0A8E0VLF4_9TREM|nr:Protocadherin-11 X-linked [Fasciolopsis buski]
MTTLQRRLWIFLIITTLTGFGILPRMTHSLKNSAPITAEAQSGGQNNLYRINMPTVYVLENATIGSVIVQDIRTHLGLPMNSMVKLGPGSLTQFFRLDNDSGRLSTIASLDLESPEICKAEKSCCRQELPTGAQQFPISKPSYSDSSLPIHGLNVVPDTFHDLPMRDTCRMMAFVLSQPGSEKQLTPVTRLYVTVVDLNDNPPVFRLTEDNNKRAGSDGKTGYSVNKHLGETPALKLAFSEGSAGLQTRHDLPSAYDADFSMVNRVKRYWLEWDKDKNKFPLDSHDSEVVLGTIPNVLTVDDQNGMTWATFGPFRLIYLEPGRNIALELDAELDREQQDLYKLILVAEDGGGLRGQVRIDVDVLDVNEFTPVFADEAPTKEQLLHMKPRTVYQKRYNVKESLTVGSELGQLRAYDADHSPGSVITYRLGPSNPPGDLTNTFHIHPKTGVLKLVGTLDYETTQQYRLIVIAQDGPASDTTQLGSRSTVPRNLVGTYRSATAIVEVNVIDVNDNAPVIRFEKEDELLPNSPKGSIATSAIGSGTVSADGSKIPCEVWIKEDLPKGSPVTFFSVSDRDLADNGRVTCSLMNWTERFRLHEFSGLYGLETMDTFDREQVDSYYLTIRCHDHGVPVLQTDRALLIHIEDVNDLPPIFQLPVYQFHVQENSPPGTPVIPASVNFPTHVTATDPDLNNTLKYYLEPRRKDMKSSSLPRAESGPASFDRLDGSLDHQLFQIDPNTGLIATQGELDREERARLMFQACADDGKHVTCTDVIVLLDDVNDNRPQFDRDTYVVRVEENQLSHKPFLTFRVTDADAGNHGFVFDFLEDPATLSETRRKVTGRNQTAISHDWEQFEPGTVRYHFALRENTLYVRRPLDREFRSNYHFFVTVTDSQEAPRTQSDGSGYRQSYPTNLTSKAEVFVDVGDVNDNTPTFIFPNSTGPSGNRLSVSCHETMGSSVSRLQATDPDLGLNATVRFSLINTPEVDPLFYLDAQSGELFVNTGQLADRCGESLIMVVSVDDQGPPESKQTRPATVERMLIKIEDKPTLAELIAAEARQQWRVLSEANSDGRLVKSSDGSSEGLFTYGALSTRTILSVVLGGSTVFLIGLLIVWMILLLYNRSRRRKHLRAHELRRFPNKSRNEPASFQSAMSAGEPSEKNTLFGTLNSVKTENQYCEQFVRNVVQGEDKPGKSCDVRITTTLEII